MVFDIKQPFVGSQAKHPIILHASMLVIDVTIFIALIVVVRMSVIKDYTQPLPAAAFDNVAAIILLILGLLLLTIHLRFKVRSLSAKIRDNSTPELPPL